MWVSHAAIKRLVRPGLGFGSLPTARRTLAGYEAMAMIRKGQVRNIGGGDMRAQAAFVAGRVGIAGRSGPGHGAFLTGPKLCTRSRPAVGCRGSCASGAWVVLCCGCFASTLATAYGVSTSVMT